MLINTDLIYPIGSIYISVNATNPSKYFGGTWEQLTGDAYLKIVTSKAGEYAGTSSEHKIPLTSIPSHRHQLGNGVMEALNTSRNFAYGGSGFEGALMQSGYSGGGQAYYPYYYGVYVFRRSA